MSQAYDPEARRDTPLALKLKAHIRRDGPIAVRDYMAACLYDPEHGYYVRQTAIGRGGDFITAPEISQIFGELIGLWAAVAWQQMGSPERVNLIELGPGRGTMMQDMLRVIASIPAFHRCLSVKLAEPSPRLRAIQLATLSGASVPVAHVEPHEMAGCPSILVANEVLDCVPIDQLVRQCGADGKAGWFVRSVELNASGRLQFGVGRPVAPPVAWEVPNAAPGDILEGGRTRLKFETLGRDFAEMDLAALFIDYGHTDHAAGDTLQAVRGHAFEHPLTSPGEADITAQVNFAQAIEGVRTAGFALDGPVTQAEFLGALGIVERASRLMGANPAKAADIEFGVARLMSPNGMGTCFKVMGVRSSTLPPLPGFPIARADR